MYIEKHRRNGKLTAYRQYMSELFRLANLVQKDSAINKFESFWYGEKVKGGKTFFDEGQWGLDLANKLDETNCDLYFHEDIPRRIMKSRYFLFLYGNYDGKKLRGERELFEEYLKGINKIRDTN